MKEAMIAMGDESNDQMSDINQNAGMESID
jgi:hypothetical protein